MGRQPCCDKVGLKRGPWMIEEDQKLMNFILNNGIHCWRLVPKLAGLLRCGKSCRLRWINYLRPDLKRGAFTEMEENQIIQLHSLLGNRWSKIAANFPGRPDNEIKNHWNTRIKKRLKQLGVDTLTQKSTEKTEKVDNVKRESVFIASNPSKNKEGSFEIESKESHKVEVSAQLVSDGIGYGMWMDQSENNTSPSFPLEYSSMSESLSIIKESSLQIDNMDSLPPLDWVPRFNHLEEEEDDDDDDIYLLESNNGYYTNPLSH